MRDVPRFRSLAPGWRIDRLFTTDRYPPHAPWSDHPTRPFFHKVIGYRQPVVSALSATRTAKAGATRILETRTV